VIDYHFNKRPPLTLGWGIPPPLNNLKVKNVNKYTMDKVISLTIGFIGLAIALSVTFYSIAFM